MAKLTFTIAALMLVGTDAVIPFGVHTTPGLPAAYAASPATAAPTATKGSRCVFHANVGTPLPRAATTFYVSQNGADSNAGTREKPWATPERVSREKYRAGDRVLFRGGEEFRGGLCFSGGASATPVDQLEISSYGTGRATLRNPGDHVIFAYNTAGLKLFNLRIVGDGIDSDHEKAGVQFFNDLPGDQKLAGVELTNVEVRDVGAYGVDFTGARGRSGFRDVRITQLDAHHNGLGGFSTIGALWNEPGAFAHQNFYLAQVRAFANPGVANWKSPSGSGIVLGGVDGAVVEHSKTFDNGERNTHVGGPVGLWAWNANRVVFQYNESYRNRTASHADGGGFDLDGGVSNSVMQYNYSHDNDGAGYLVCAFATRVPQENNVVRFNVSENDGRRNDYGGIAFYDEPHARLRNVRVHNNTVHVSAAPGATPAAINVATGSAPTGVRVYDNLFVVDGAPVARFSAEPAGFTFSANRYQTSSGRASPDGDRIAQLVKPPSATPMRAPASAAPSGAQTSAAP